MTFSNDTSFPIEESSTPVQSKQDEEPLVDICNFFDDRWDYPDCEIPIRIEKNKSGPAAFMRCPVPAETYLAKCAPVSLLELLEGNHLSSRSKISLAFTLSKSIWQYYDSKWMKMRWDLKAIKILRQTKGAESGIDHECRMPFLEISSSNSSVIYCEQETQMKREGNNLGELHPYPYILTLGMLLVQICLRITPTNIIEPRRDTGNNRVYMHYLKEMDMEGTSWPVLDLRDEYRKMYREIVAHCLPPRRSGWTSPLFSSEIDAVGRRNLLMKHVVGPLHKLLNYASGITSNETKDVVTGHQNHKSAAGVMTKPQSSQRYARTSG